MRRLDENNIYSCTQSSDYCFGYPVTIVYADELKANPGMLLPKEAEASIRQNLIDSEVFDVVIYGYDRDNLYLFYPNDECSSGYGDVVKIGEFIDVIDAEDSLIWFLSQYENLGHLRCKWDKPMIDLWGNSRNPHEGLSEEYCRKTFGWYAGSSNYSSSW